MRTLFATMAVTFLTACGSGGGEEGNGSGYHWDGFIAHGTIEWRCRDASNGQFIENAMCNDQKVNDNKWPTEGVPRETNLWARGVSIETVCKDQMAKVPFASQYKRVSIQTLPQFYYKGTIMRDEWYPHRGWATYHYSINRMINISEIINWQYYWNYQNDSSISWQKDENDWIVWLIKAPRANTGIYPAQCVALSMENGVYNSRVFD